MSSFTDPLVVMKVGPRTWQIDRDFYYHVGEEGSTEVIKVPMGFRTDFASVPRIFWTLFPPDGLYSQAAVLHDWLYHTLIYSRYKSDLIFYEAMGVLGVPGWKRSIMYMSVRMVAWVCWNQRTKITPTSPRNYLKDL